MKARQVAYASTPSSLRSSSTLRTKRPNGSVADGRIAKKRSDRYSSVSPYLCSTTSLKLSQFVNFSSLITAHTESPKSSGPTWIRCSLLRLANTTVGPRPPSTLSHYSQKTPRSLAGTSHAGTPSLPNGVNEARSSVTMRSGSAAASWARVIVPWVAAEFKLRCIISCKRSPCSMRRLFCAVRDSLSTYANPSNCWMGVRTCSVSVVGAGDRR